MDFYEIAYEFLSSAKIDISKSYLQERLEAHPHYPALNSLTDLLDELKIENYPMLIEEKHRWRELKYPFLTHIISINGELDFQVIKHKKQIISENDFLAKWNGITLLLGEKKNILHEEHNRIRKKEKKEKNILFSIIIAFIIVGLIQQLISFTPVHFTHYILSIIGLAISYSIVAFSLGIKTNVSDMLCNLESSGCNSVLQSKLGKFSKDFGLGDIAVVVFCGLSLYMSTPYNFEANSNLLFLSIIQLVILLFTFISIIYQLYLGSWCKLCLLLTLIIWLQTINLFFHLDISNLLLHTVSLFKLSIAFIISLLISSIWLIVKPLLLTKNKNIHQNIRMRKWRQNPYWFHALLPLHRRIDDSAWDKEIFYGNPKGVIQFVIISTPFCKYCAIAHEELEEILDKTPNDIGVRIRFTLPTTNKETEDYNALFQIINTYEKYIWEKNLDYTSPLMKNIIRDWFRTKNIEKWLSIYPTQSNDTSNIHKLINQSVTWANTMNINQTPAFFINGYEMPNPHTFKDLFLFISDYIEILKNLESKT